MTRPEKGSAESFPASDAPASSNPAGAEAAPLEDESQGRLSVANFDRLIAAASAADVVLLGESTHGTADFYRERSRITKRLLDELDFSAVVVEADWPDAYRVNQYVKGESNDADADDALAGFKRFPSWMWRNTQTRDLVEWMRARNSRLSGDKKSAFLGLDLYSLSSSIQAVLTYLDEADPEAAGRARDRYACFDHFGRDSEAYGQMTQAGAEDCEEEVVAQLTEMLRSSESPGRDDIFNAEQNARVVRAAESYYRAMFRSGVESWNLRDRHMFESLEAIRRHLERAGTSSKVVVWAHNSHVGDARATAMSDIGELNLGQLVRERWGKQSFIVGFTTHHGTVTAAEVWGGAPRIFPINPALYGSFEADLHARVGDCLLIRDQDTLPEGRRLERAIGVIYRPETERMSHYFDADIADQFDALVHFDQTSALSPLDPSGEGIDLPDAMPSEV